MYRQSLIEIRRRDCIKLKLPLAAKGADKGITLIINTNKRYSVHLTSFKYRMARIRISIPFIVFLIFVMLMLEEIVFLTSVVAESKVLDGRHLVVAFTKTVIKIMIHTCIFFYVVLIFFQ